MPSSTHNRRLQEMEPAALCHPNNPEVRGSLAYSLGMRALVRLALRPGCPGLNSWEFRVPSSMPIRVRSATASRRYLQEREDSRHRLEKAPVEFKPILGCGEI